MNALRQFLGLDHTASGASLASAARVNLHHLHAGTRSLVAQDFDEAAPVSVFNSSLIAIVLS